MRKKFLKKISTVGFAAVVAVGLLAGCGKTDQSSKSSKTTYRAVDEIKESGTINIGVFSDKAPFGYVDENGEYQGYDIYFAERLGKDRSKIILIIAPSACTAIGITIFPQD